MFILLGIIAVLPQLWIKYPGLIDDGSDFLKIGKTSYWNILWSGLINDERLRPVSWLYKKTVFEIFGLQIWGHYLIGGIVLGLICFLIFKICKEIGINKYLLSIVATSTLVLPSIYANFYRLGTNEPLQLLLLLCVYYSWLKKSSWMVWIFSTLCLYTKETSLFMILIFTCLSLNLKNKTLVLVNMISWISCGVLILLRLLRPNLSYINQSRLTLDYLILYIQLGGFSVILDLIALLSVIYILYKRLYRKTKILILIWLWVSSIMPIFIWNIGIQEYYLMVHQVMSLILVFVVVDQIIKKNVILRRTWIKTLLPLGILPLFILIFLSCDLQVINYWHRKGVLDGTMAGFLLNNNFEKISIYSGILDFEINHKIFLYSNNWNKKYSDSFYPNMEEWLGHDVADSDYFDNQIELARQDFIKSENANKIYITDRIDLEFEQRYSKLLICGRTPFMKKTCDFVIYSDDTMKNLLTGKRGRIGDSKI